MDSEASIPQNWISLFRGGGGGGLGEGGQQFVLRRLQAVGRHNTVSTHPGRTVTQLNLDFQVGGSIPGRPTFVGSTTAEVGQPGSNRRPKSLWFATLPFGHCLP